MNSRRPQLLDHRSQLAQGTIRRLYCFCDLSSVICDLKYAFRQLRKTPGFTMIAILTLAVGIGVNAAVFSLINGWLLRPLPGQRDGKLVRLFCRSTESEGKYQSFSYPFFKALQKDSSAFTHIAAFSQCLHLLRNEGISRTVVGAYVSANFFDALGVTLAQGRGFTEAEEKPGQHAPVVVISHRFWHSLGADPQLVGQTLTLTDLPVTVVGILPVSFVSASQLTCQDIWLPLGMKGGFAGSKPIETHPRLLAHDYRPLFLVGQRKPGISIASAGASLNRSAERLSTVHPQAYRQLLLSSGPVGNILMSHRPGQKLPIAKPLAALVAVSTCILLIACLNLAHMFLARGLSRQRELNIRMSMGCGRWRLTRQLVTEGFLLSLIGMGTGLLLALWSIRTPIRAFEQWTGGSGTIPAELDWRLILAGFALCLLTTLLFSLGPAWRLTRSCQMTQLRESMGSTVHQKPWLRKTLIAAQVALAFMLVTCAGLFVQSARAAALADPGFSLDRGLLIQVALRENGRQTIQRITSQLRALPGIQTVSLSSYVPFGDAHMPGRFQRAKAAPSKERTSVYANIASIGSDYFKSLDLGPLRGREFTLVEEQSQEGPRVALIDRILAERLWPQENPLGQFLQHADDSERSYQIVGVVPHLRATLLEAQPVPLVYLPYGQRYDHAVFINVQCAAPLTPGMVGHMKHTLQETLLGLVPDLRLRGIRTWREQIESFSFQSLCIKLGAQVFATLGLLALGLATLGLFSVKSHWVAQRTNEFGIRLALGATAQNVISHVLKEGLLLTGIGLLAGLFLTWIGTRFLESLLYEIRGTNLKVLLFSIIVMVTTILLVSFFPARRAAKVDPMEALRYE